MQRCRGILEKDCEPFGWQGRCKYVLYDDWIYSKMALAVHSVEFIRELFVARWKQTGSLNLEDYVELSYRYAREIEHSDQNLNELEECFVENWNFFQ